MSTSSTGRHEAPEPRITLGSELRDAIAPRTVALVVGVLVLQLGFILSYLGAFHMPRPHRIEVAAVAPSSLVSRLNGLDGEPLHVRSFASADAVRSAVANGDVPVAFVLDPHGTADTLLVAAAKGTSTATAEQAVFEALEKEQHRRLTTTDVVPLQAGDGPGCPASIW